MFARSMNNGKKNKKNAKHKVASVASTAGKNLSSSSALRSSFLSSVCAEIERARWKKDYPF